MPNITYSKSSDDCHVMLRRNAVPQRVADIRSGKVRAIAVTTVTRSEILPDISTMAEFLPGFEVSAWFGIGAPKNTPIELVNKLNKEINAGLADPKIKVRLTELAAISLEGSPTDLAGLSLKKLRNGAKSFGRRTSSRSKAGPSTRADPWMMRLCAKSPAASATAGLLS
jgi:hypothetical protein